MEEGKNESEEEKRKVSQKKRRIAQKKKNRERKSVNLPNEEGVGIDHLFIEKPEERDGSVQDNIYFSFLFEDSNIEWKEKRKKRGMLWRSK